MKATFEEMARAHALLALARTAKSRAYVDVAARVTELRGDPERVIEKAAITMADVVAKLAKIGFADMTAIIPRLCASNSVAKLEAQWTLLEEPA
jgi:hypothetical protein